MLIAENDKLKADITEYKDLIKKLNKEYVLPGIEALTKGDMNEANHYFRNMANIMLAYDRFM